MNRHHSYEEKLEVVNEILGGKGMKSLCRERHLDRHTVFCWLDHRAAFEVAVFGVPGHHLYRGEMLFYHDFLCCAVLVADDVQAFLGLGQAPAVK